MAYYKLCTGENLKLNFNGLIEIENLFKLFSIKLKLPRGKKISMILELSMRNYDISKATLKIMREKKLRIFNFRGRFSRKKVNN